MSINPDPATILTVTRWVDPVVDERGVAPRSLYVERFWLPVIGPTASWVYRRLTDELAEHPDGVEVNLSELAASMGLSHRPERPGPFGRAVQRCVMFGLAAPTPGGLAVRCVTPQVAQRHADRFPDSLRAEHDRLIGAVAGTAA